MFGIDSGELFIIAIVALLVIGPKDLPRVMRAIGNFVGKARGMAGHFRAGVDNMIRESELQDMEKVWKANNERIMRAAPPPPPTATGARPTRRRAGRGSAPALPRRRRSLPPEAAARAAAPPARQGGRRAPDARRAAGG